MSGWASGSEQVQVSGRPTQFFLTAAGNNTGAYNLNGNYSASPLDIYYEATSHYDLYSLLVVISDNANFNQADYGAIVGGLTNGVSFFIKPSGLPEIPLLSGVSVKHNYEWLTLNHDFVLTSFAGLAQTATISFEITEDYGKPINMSSGDRFIVRLNDDFTGLVSHTFGLRGIKF
ncbi:MAG: hypothetical protein WC714_28615 [Candidatus Obscuribacterales bacterium]|jgi:hypothetical protein